MFPDGACGCRKDTECESYSCPHPVRGLLITSRLAHSDRHDESIEVGRMRRVLAVALAVVLTVVLSAARGAAAPGFPAGPPNDPDYAPAEQGTVLTCLTKAAPGGEQHNLYSFMPRCTPAA